MKLNLERINQRLAAYLPAADVEPQRLHQAMRYAVLNGGKRLRPLLVYAAGEALGARLEQLDAAACAVELIHAYSLVHDDLPSMDNDDFRRGQPTCHKAFDEATAILVGDALQALAFEILARENDIALIMVLAKACGSNGMAGGQALEFASLGSEITPQQLECIQRLKTGALIQASVRLGAMIGKANATQLEQLDRYAGCLGLAFQIQDDIEDGCLMDKETAKQKIQTLYQQALTAIELLAVKTEPLKCMAEYMIS